MLAFTDALTGLANRRAFDDTLEREWKRAVRHDTPLALIMIDVDYFKSYNDRYGHQAGDSCLQQVAQAMGACIARPGDLLARYGGEEFVALLAGTGEDGAIALAEKLRAAVARAAIRHDGSSLGSVSVSLGIAARVSASEDAAELVARADAELYRSKERGRNRATAAGYSSDAVPAERTTVSARTNLPGLTSPTIGRARERAELRALVQRHPLVTIAGVGGSGKTRMAIQTALDELDNFEDGAWLIDLSVLGPASSVSSAIASALSIAVSDDEQDTAALAKVLRRRRTLLVIDNCEHVRGQTAAVLTALIGTCPRLRVLATSRIPIGITGEETYRLPALERSDAIALFTERAKSAKPSFALTEANTPAVERICGLVDGIALGIELIAPRIAVVSPEQLAERLGESFSIATAGRRTALERHQTMHALIDWSYELLEPDERRVFARLATFSGSWTLEAMSAVCSGDAFDAFALYDVHAALLNASLVSEEPSHDERRYRLLEPIRDYAREQLEIAGESDAMAHRHAAHFARRAAAADESFYVTPSRMWFADIHADLANYRAALTWCIERGNDRRLGAEIAASLSWYFYYSYPSEGTRWIRAALAGLEHGEARMIEARLHLGLTPLYGLTPAEKRCSGERAVEIYRAGQDPLRLSHALRMLGLTLAWYFPAEHERADLLIAQAHALALQLDDPIATALVLQARSQVLESGDLVGRKRLKEEAYRLLREHGNDRQISVVLTDLSEGAFAEGDEEGALSYGREALAIAQASGSRNTMLCAVINLAHYAAAQADWTVAGEAGNQALRWSDESQAAEFITYAINALACVAAGLNHPERAARLFGFCNTRFGTMHAPRHEGMCEDVLYRRTMEHLAESLSANELEAALAAGAQLNEDAAIVLARYGSTPSNDSR